MTKNPHCSWKGRDGRDTGRAMAPSARRALIGEIGETLAGIETLEVAGDAGVPLARARFDKWRLIHKFIHGNPFHVSERLARSDQWRKVHEHLRDLGDEELLGWLRLQAEVATNIEKGIQDLRPRKNGPCYGVLLEFVSNAKRKARAVLKWAEEGEKNGVYRIDSAWHARTADILKRHGLIETDEEGNPVYSTDPMTRS